MEATAISKEMQQCIDVCLDCYQTCFTEAMRRCVPAGGRHMEGRHLALMLNCAELCRTTAEFMMAGSALHTRICAACAEVCEACAQSCEQAGDMDECVAACRRCAASCRQMSGAGASAQGFSGSQQQDADSPVKMPM